MKLPVLSYTFLNTYDICPKQAFHRYVLKDCPFVGSKESAWGNTVHDAMDKRLSKKTPLPPEVAQYEFYAATLEPLKPQTEMKLGITRGGEPCGFFADEVWLRGKADVVTMNDTTGLLFDWKTGKRREDPYELELQALMLWAARPKLVRITGHYIWLKDNAVGKPHDLSNVGETLECLQEKADEIESCHKRGEWRTKEGPLCGFCPVKSCGFNRSGK